MKENEMGETCGTHGGELYAYTLWVRKNIQERNHWKDYGIDGSTIFPRIQKIK
jgi:hypothetical protein